MSEFFRSLRSRALSKLVCGNYESALDAGAIPVTV
jgi:hypothetical protein